MSAVNMHTNRTSPLLWLIIALVVAGGLVAFLAALFAPYGQGYGMMGFGMGWMAVAMVIPVFILILVLVVALPALTLSPPPVPMYVPSTSSALETLNARYARGEISRDEYLRIRADLEGRTT